LEENGVPLPDSELRLYDERMRLLLGHYDVHKQISRITSQRHDLERISQKIAFHFQISGRREEDRDILYKIAFQSLKNSISKEKSDIVVDELIDPCNILVPMTEDGKFGFGHLRYQEYLTALELRNNRGIQIAPLLKQEWWRGVFILFSQLDDNIEWLINSAVISDGLRGCEATIKAMIDIKPNSEREKLYHLLDMHKTLDHISPQLDKYSKDGIEEFRYNDKWEEF
jgi:hypothetical protein